MIPILEMTDEERDLIHRLGLTRIYGFNIKEYSDVIFDVVNTQFKDSVKDNANGVKRGFIMPDGRFIDTKLNPHYYFEDKVVDYLKRNLGYVFTFLDSGLGSNIFDMLGCIRINGTGENYVGLSNNRFNKITSAQQSSLEEWLNYYFYTLNELEITVATVDKQQVTYNRNEYEPKEIVQKINRYYNGGMLYENKRKYKGWQNI